LEEKTAELLITGRDFKLRIPARSILVIFSRDSCRRTENPDYEKTADAFLKSLSLRVSPIKKVGPASLPGRRLSLFETAAAREAGKPSLKPSCQTFLDGLEQGVNDGPCWRETAPGRPYWR